MLGTTNASSCRHDHSQHSGEVRYAHPPASQPRSSGSCRGRISNQRGHYLSHGNMQQHLQHAGVPKRFISTPAASRSSGSTGLLEPPATAKPRAKTESPADVPTTPTPPRSSSAQTDGPADGLQIAAPPATPEVPPLLSEPSGLMSPAGPSSHSGRLEAVERRAALAAPRVPIASWQDPAALLRQAAAAVAGTVGLIPKRTWLLDSVADLIAKSRGGTPPGLQYFTGNYTPLVDNAEMSRRDLAVQGVLPAELDGVYLRTGPNPVFQPTHGYHWFDGDGLIHATRLSGGRASYSSRYVRTSRLLQEQAAGRPLFWKFGDAIGRQGLALMALDSLRHLVGRFDVSQGLGSANTSLAYHAGRLMALHEADLPYQISVSRHGEMDTLGRLSLPAKDGMRMDQFTAHPKIDPRTGELYFFSYYMSRPYVRIGVLDASGALSRQWSVDVPDQIMMHDMCITERYLVLLDLPLGIDVEGMINNDANVVGYNASRPARIGLLRRNAPGGKAEKRVRWFELPAFVMFHTINACEDADGNVRVWGCRFDGIEMAGGDDLIQQATPHLITLDIKSGKADTVQISPIPSEMPTLNPGMLGRPGRWGWLGVNDPTSAVNEFAGIAKLDLTLHLDKRTSQRDRSANDGNGHSTPVDAVVGRITFPAGCRGGEPYFVARHADAPATADNEDDGFLLVYMARGLDAPSQLHVYDARTMASEPLAVVTLPRRVPLGFHGLWITEEQRARAESAAATKQSLMVQSR